MYDFLPDYQHFIYVAAALYFCKFFICQQKRVHLSLVSNCNLQSLKVLKLGQSNIATICSFLGHSLILPFQALTVLGLDLEKKIGHQGSNLSKYLQMYKEKHTFINGRKAGFRACAYFSDFVFFHFFRANTYDFHFIVRR